MIQVIQGNLLDARGIICHGCNTAGSMGAGIAAQIKAKWPRVYRSYAFRVKQHNEYEVTDRPEASLLGQVQFVRVEKGIIVANCFTQSSYGRKRGVKYASYDAIDDCMMRVAVMAKEEGLSVNFPKIGAGLGGLEWPVVAQIIESRLDDTIIKNLWIP